MAPLIRLRGILLCALLTSAQAVPVHPAAPVTEDAVKAVFLFNFAHFIEWPPGVYAAASQPFVIAVAGGDSLLPALEDAVRGESVDGHPMRVQRVGASREERPGHILFIGRSQAAQLPSILAGSRRSGTLTVSDLPDAARQGVMIEMVNDRNRIRLRINLEAARAAGLTISSNLLRPAEIVTAEVR